MIVVNYTFQEVYITYISQNCKNAPIRNGLSNKQTKKIRWCAERDDDMIYQFRYWEHVKKYINQATCCEINPQTEMTPKYAQNNACMHEFKSAIPRRAQKYLLSVFIDSTICLLQSAMQTLKFWKTNAREHISQKPIDISTPNIHSSQMVCNYRFGSQMQISVSDICLSTEMQPQRNWSVKHV